MYEFMHLRSSMQPLKLFIIQVHLFLKKISQCLFKNDVYLQHSVILMSSEQHLLQLKSKLITL